MYLLQPKHVALRVDARRNVPRRDRLARLRLSIRPVVVFNNPVSRLSMSRAAK